MTIPTLKAHNARLASLLLKVQALKKPPNGWPIDRPQSKA